MDEKTIIIAVMEWFDISYEEADEWYQRRTERGEEMIPSILEWYSNKVEAQVTAYKERKEI